MSELADTVSEAIEKSHEPPPAGEGGFNLNGMIAVSVAEAEHQFDMAEALMSVAIALLGITALTRKRRLLYVGWAFAGFGFVLGIAGFAGLKLHPEFLARLLG